MCLLRRKDTGYGQNEIYRSEFRSCLLRLLRSKFVPRDAFVYEYVGDVVNPASFKKRMREYAAEGIQHFYFMMLQKDEVRDAFIRPFLLLTTICAVHRRDKEWRHWSFRKS